MNSKHSENIVIYLGVGASILLLSGLVRYIFISSGIDEFTANVVFTVAIILGVFFYMSFIQILQDLYSAIMKKTSNPKGLKKDDDKQEKLSKIIERKQQEKNLKQQEKENTAIQYTKEKFATYISSEDLIKLCEYIKLYSVKGSFSNIKSIKVDTLSTLDIYHFGWNIWRHFSVGKQKNMAYFLKHIFAELLKDVEVETIKKHLKDDELKGIIKIENPLIFKN